jgi:hypothetical protein
MMVRYGANGDGDCE